MAGLLILAKAFLIKEVTIMVRYAPNSVGAIITLYLIFLLLFLGYQGVAGGAANFGDMIEGLVVGYCLWLFSLMTYQEVSSTIQSEAREGTLEQLYMSRFGFGYVIGFKVLVNLFLNLLLVAIMLGLMTLTTKRVLNMDLITLFPLVTFTLFSILGLGFMVGGITLVYKRMDSYLQIIQFALIGLVAAPVTTLPWLRILPASFGAHMIRKTMIEGASLASFSFFDYALLIGVGLVYLLAGYRFYLGCEKRAMKQGLLGHY